jgi:acyl-coenzyme A thioesterase PaaI-like protein
MSRQSIFTPRLKSLTQQYAITGLQQAWKFLAPAPGGRKVFAALLGRLVPYSGSVKPRILELEPGRAKIAMDDRWATRNHLGSLHALALANIGEMACGLALNIGLPEGYGAILRRIEVEYLKKARGTVVSSCQLNLKDLDLRNEGMVQATSDITDSAGVVVARTHTEWKVGPLAKSSHAKAKSEPAETPQ